MTGAYDTMARACWTHEETDAHHVFLSLKFTRVPLPQTSPLASWSCQCRDTAYAALVQPKPFKQHWTWGGHSPCDLTDILRLGAVAFTVGFTCEAYPCRKSHPTCSLHDTWLVADGLELGAYDARTERQKISNIKNFDRSASLLWKTRQLTWPYKQCSYPLLMHQLGRWWPAGLFHHWDVLHDNQFLLLPWVTYLEGLLMLSWWSGRPAHLGG